MSLTKFYIKIRQFFSIEYNSILIVLALHMSFLIGQIYYQADPYNLLKYEKDIYNNFHIPEDTQEEEYIVTEEVILALQTLLLSRYYANIELNKFSRSLSLH